MASSFGTILSSATITSGTVGTYAEVADVVKVGFGEIKSVSYDQTPLNAPDGVEQLKPSGKVTIDETELTLNLLSDTQVSGFQTDLEAGTIKSWKIAFGDVAELVFQGWISSMKFSSADAGSPEAYTFDVKIQPTTKPVFS